MDTLTAAAGQFLVDFTSDDVTAVDTLMAEVCGHGFLGELAREHLAGGGKRLRARLALRAAEALGGAGDVAVAWAAACELLHNASLVHDDIHDGDTERRDRPTVWAAHGIPQAINTGDAMIMLAFRALERAPCSPARRWGLVEAIVEASLDAVRGQADDLSLLGTGRLSMADWEHTARGKSGALFGLPVHGAALLAGETPAAAERLARPFVGLGVLYQACDDLLDLAPCKGRAQGTDIREGRVTLLVVEQLNRRPDTRDWICAALTGEGAGTVDERVQAVLDRYRESGAVDAARRRALALAQAVVDAPALRDVPSLAALARGMVALTLSRTGVAFPEAGAPARAAAHEPHA